MRAKKHPCPCCGYCVFDQAPGSHTQCPICLWEDNLAQLRFPLMPGGANTVSLADAQRNFVQCGAAEKRNTGLTREPLDYEVRDEEWRMLDRDRDNIEEPQRGISYGDTHPISDPTVLYYWRANYWRRRVS